MFYSINNSLNYNLPKNIFDKLYIYLYFEKKKITFAKILKKKHRLCTTLIWINNNQKIIF